MFKLLQFDVNLRRLSRHLSLEIVINDIGLVINVILKTATLDFSTEIRSCTFEDKVAAEPLKSL